MKEVKGFIQIYTKSSRQRIFNTTERFLINAGVQGLTEDVYSCIDELIKNAVKANYKFLLIKDDIIKDIASKHPDYDENELEHEFHEIITSKERYDDIANRVLNHREISKEVREILNEEARYLSIKNRTYDENRECTDEENASLEKLEKLNDIREKIRKNDIKIILKIQSDDDFLYLEVTNTAPILEKDLRRIYEKRSEHKKYKDEGREHEFFINHLDTSESGFGLGYATIDSFLIDWGLEPESAATIISSINTTAMLILPVPDLKKKVRLMK